MKRVYNSIIIAGILICMAGAVLLFVPGHERPVVTIVYIGEKGDFGFLDSAYLGLILARDDFNFISHEMLWDGSDSQDPVIVDDGKRADLVLILGDLMSGYAETVANKYPKTPIVVIDSGPVPGDSIRSVSFSMYGASYLAGVLAANQTKTEKIGVIAAKDAPVITSFTDGFVDGVYSGNPDAEVSIIYLADDDTGFTMPEKAAEVARSMYADGTDLIFTVAGGSGPGAITAAKELPGLLIIGVDSDQSELAPKTVIASVVKRVDQVVYDEIEAALSGRSVAGEDMIGLSDGGSALIINPRFPEIGNLIEERYSEAAEKEAEYLLMNENG
ncbi:BMP family ABC transporter substrate-binding protein [Methanocalculus taiwanensis]|uniref:BMP family ABC transporter substrate-binding protein n=1 Tax=Methanocalculus taiwanensis TaxID=106207 RepID=A0ABD4TFA4_9EURY|nr:BMP family ABC transporter substrate-binding protein [Methanocalculus taiwanensis]MCQ1537396.1 BMP family ABC transporter substrate-binding protein [Methanocalculus taiwanensis]